MINRFEQLTGMTVGSQTVTAANLVLTSTAIVDWKKRRGLMHFTESYQESKTEIPAVLRNLEGVPIQIENKHHGHVYFKSLANAWK
ncbi:hypothetical protein DICVIV_08310 [Dictyocaulus viviparus]|uniref:Uncharacterized protein n=1 Tax=Dictyocaulus viviparus TaxID=29172 RepID=A0A0D8XPE9_DICVI|nr:hypothetical protein DICVIV_08310 [Dictyocaulus viviparus]